MCRGFGSGTVSHSCLLEDASTGRGAGATEGSLPSGRIVVVLMRNLALTVLFCLLAMVPGLATSQTGSQTKSSPQAAAGDTPVTPRPPKPEAAQAMVRAQ